MATFPPIFIGPYVPPFRPLSNITPFTYNDGLTYLEVLEDLRKYVNDDLVKFVNENFGELDGAFTTEVTRLIDEIKAGFEIQDENVATQLEAAIETVNNTVNGLNDLVEDVNSRIDEVNTSLATLQDNVNQQMQDNAVDMDGLTNYVNEQVQAIINNSVSVADPTVKGIIQNPASETRILLDGLYDVNTVGDPVIASVIDDEDSDTRAVLDGLYGTPAITPETIDGTVATIIADEDSDTRTALDLILDALHTVISGEIAAASPTTLDAAVITTGTFGVNRIPNLENLNGTLDIASGGTGATTQSGALTALGLTFGTAAPSGGNNGNFYAQII